MSHTIRIQTLGTPGAADRALELALGPTFEAKPGQSLLDAAAEHGIELPYSCRKGVCGNCRGRVLEGKLVPGTEGGPREAGVELADEHLLCRAQAASDLLIAPREWRLTEASTRKKYTVRVFRNERVASDISVLTLRFANGVRARYAAGQYAQVLLANGQRRAFSMANAPYDNDHVQLHIRHRPGTGFTSTTVPYLVKGDTLDIELPHGDFYLREASDRPLLFIAGGTGFAPIKAMIDSLLKKNNLRPIYLFWGARDPSGLYAPHVVSAWQRRRPDLGYEPVISNALESRDRLVSPSGVLAAVMDSFNDLHGYDVYTCGAPQMVQNIRTSLQDLRRLPAGQFFSDSFVNEH
jgi:NAD(P)H-flavin reductase/ferredoxin